MIPYARQIEPACATPEFWVARQAFTVDPAQFERPRRSYGRTEDFQSISNRLPSISIATEIGRITREKTLSKNKKAFVKQEEGEKFGSDEFERPPLALITRHPVELGPVDSLPQ
ncbi:hypothetical protein [Methylosinus sp. PW1]|uniref:hypothetical protein n=1 Tax=Methylosinus sp. PW1 TaxID=107636 RepID=UPI0005640A13|nr:hypothetical protein [Methylosinus sp. PW1]